MIHVTVGTKYLQHVLAGRGPAIESALARVIERLKGGRFRSVNAAEELQGVSVHDVMVQFHTNLGILLEKEGQAILELLEFELRNTAERVYGLPTIQVTTKHANDLLALYGPLPHGTNSSGKPVFLFDMASGVRLFGSIINKIKITPIEEKTPPAFVTTTNTGTRELECHLCDDLFEVYRRAETFRSAEQKGHDNYAELFLARGHMPPIQYIDDGEEILLLDAALVGFWGYRSLQRTYSVIPPIANHRLLAASALRQGMGKPIISSIIPHGLWRELKAPVQHFILDAGEMVGGLICTPVYPNTPDAKTMDDLCLAVASEDNPKPSDTQAHLSRIAEPELDFALKQLGLRDPIEAAIKQLSDREEKGEWVWDYRSAVVELRNSLYGIDIERSLLLENTLMCFASVESGKTLRSG